MMNDEHSDARPEASNVSKFSGSYALFSDAKLVAMVRAGDERAFEQLMQRYLPIVTAYLWGKMWERGEIEDLTQEIFVRAYTKISQLRDASRFHQWILRIARHRWADYCRSTDTQQRKSHIDIDAPTGETGHSHADTKLTPITSAAERELQELVRSAIGDLKERYRLILYLRLIDGQTNSEIAQLTGLKENAVRTRFSRGLGTLKKILIKKGLQPF